MRRKSHTNIRSEFVTIKKTYFESELIKELYKLTGIETTRTIIYHAMVLQNELIELCLTWLGPLKTHKTAIRINIFQLWPLHIIVQDMRQNLFS